MNTMVRGLTVAALTAGVIGGVAGMAQAQVMPRHGHAVTAVQPSTRDMSLTSSAAARPADDRRQTCHDGVRLRSAPVTGAILGLCYYYHSINWNNNPERYGPDGTLWTWVQDFTTGVSGWARNDGIGYF